MDMIPKTIHAVAGPNYTVYTYFLNNTVCLSDENPLFEKGSASLPLRDGFFPYTAERF